MVFAQYSNLFSLGLFLIVLLPAVVLGILGKRLKAYGMIISIPALCLIMGFNSLQFWQFVGFIFFEILLVIYYAKRRKFYYLVFALSIMPIILTKLSECFMESFGSYSLIGFLGISYVSFRVWQLLFEAHDDKLNDFSISELLYFITFFPTISSGPIDRYKRFKEDLDRQISKNEYINDYLIPGIRKILFGIAYKFAIASLIKLYVLDTIPSSITFSNTLVYMYAYTLFLFFDFAGYSNFAIGASYFLGIKSPENFNKPFLAHNMKEFWDRWHISLSKWFGDYIFSRFVLNVLRSKKIKSKKVAVRAGYMLTMTIMGLWHGFHIFYLLYGVYQGIMLVVTDVYIKSKTFRKFKKSKYYDLLSRVVCFHVIAFGMLIFSGYLFKF